MESPRPAPYDIFGSALLVEAGEARAAYVQRACGGDSSLLAEIESLLAVYQQAEGFLESKDPAIGSCTPPTLNDGYGVGSGQMIGRYRLLELIAEGGFGSVWMAEQKEPVRRRVALKVIKLGMDTRAVIARFEAERQALAMMEHPNIARVLDAGATDTGRPYFVMEYIPAATIVEYCQSEGLGIEDRLHLFIQVCNAIQHAHQKGVIHRDIKPSNVLVMAQDGRTVPKVIDFGIAKATEGDLTDKTLFTQHRQLIGTPAYMSPEQATMSGIDVDTRSDIYSLGVLLYELLVGQPPFENKELMSKSFDEMLRTIREVEPLTPSSRLTKISRSGGRPARPPRRGPRRGAGLARELDWIVMKCLDKDRGRRYESAGALALDLQRYLDGEAVLAAPASRTYRLRKVIRRNRGLVSAAAALILMLVLGLAGTLVGLRQTLLAREGLAAAMLEASREAERASTAEAAALRRVYTTSMLGASDAMERWSFDTARQYLLQAPESLRGWEWRHMMARLSDAPTVRDSGSADPARMVFAPDGSSYWTLQDSVARHRDSDSGALIRSVPISEGVYHTSSDETFFATFHWSDAVDGTIIQIRHIASRDEQVSSRVLRGHRLGRRPTLISESTVAYAEAGRLALLDLDSREVRTSMAAGLEHVIGSDPQGRFLVAIDARGAIYLFDPETMELIESHSLHRNTVQWFACSADGATAATAGRDGTVWVWKIAGRQLRPHARLDGHQGGVWQVALSSDGAAAVSVGEDRTARLWDTGTGEMLCVFAAEGFSPVAAAFMSSNRAIIAADLFGRIRIWNIDAAETDVLRGHASFVYPLTLVEDDEILVSGGWDGFVGRPGALRFWDASSGAGIAALGEPGRVVRSIALSPDQRVIAVPGSGPSGSDIELLDLRTGETVLRFAGPLEAETLSFSPDGRLLAFAGHRGCEVFDSRTGLHVRTLGSERRDCNSFVAWSRSADVLATAVPCEGMLTLWDGRTLEALRSWSVGKHVSAIAFAPDGQRLATGQLNGTVHVWGLDGALLAELHGHGHHVLCLAFSPDGKRLASGGRDNNVRVWNTQNYDQVAKLAGHDDYVYSLTWSRDSQRLYSGSGDATIRIWDTLASWERLAARDHWVRIAADMQPVVGRLMDELGDPEAVIQTLDADPSVSPRARQIGRQLVLRMIIASRAAPQRGMDLSAQLPAASSASR